MELIPEILKDNYITSMRSLLTSLEENTITDEERQELGDIYRAMLSLQQRAVHKATNEYYEKWRIQK